MKIAYICGFSLKNGGGVSESIRLLANLINSVPEYEVEIFTLLDTEDQDLSAWGDFSVRAFPYRGPLKFGYSSEMRRALLASDADLVHIHGIWKYQGYITWRWFKRNRKPYVVSPHGMLEPWIMARSPRRKAIISRLFQDRLIRNASFLHALTETERVEIIRLYGELPTSVIPNYVPEPSRPTYDRPKWLPEEHSGKDVYLYFGRIHEKKGCYELLRAWNDICEKDEQFRSQSVLVYCGWIDGLPNFSGDVANVAKSHNNVLYAGPQYGADKEESFACATFFILPSKSEGLPISVLEAWAAGAIVMMTDECNLKAGFASKAALRIGFSAVEIIQGLRVASRLEEDEKESLRRAGRKLVAEQYSKTVVLRSFVELYRKAMDG